MKKREVSNRNVLIITPFIIGCLAVGFWLPPIGTLIAYGVAVVLIAVALVLAVQNVKDAEREHRPNA